MTSFGPAREPGEPASRFGSCAWKWPGCRRRCGSPSKAAKRTGASPRAAADSARGAPRTARPVSSFGLHWQVEAGCSQGTALRRPSASSALRTAGRSATRFWNSPSAGKSDRSSSTARAQLVTVNR